jgi:hypothetical protein
VPISPKRLAQLGRTAAAGGDPRDYTTQVPVPADLDYAHQNQVYFGDPNGPITPQTLGQFEQLAAINAGGSGTLPALPLLNNPAGDRERGAVVANVRAIFTYLGVDGETWSDEWWTNLTGVTGFTGTPANILSARLACLATCHKLVRIEYVEDSASRLTVREDIFQQGTRVIPPTGISPTDLALVLSLRLADGTSRKWWCRGIGDQDWSVSASGNHLLAAAFAPKINSFILQMSVANWGVRRLTRVPLRPPNVVYLSSVNGQTNPGMSLVTCAAPHLFSLGDEIIVYRTNEKDLPHLRGHWRVAGLTNLTTGLALPANQFYVSYRTPLDQGPIPCGGFVRKAVYAGIVSFALPSSQPALLNPKLLHVAHHDTKESIFGSRGARRATRSRQLA